MAASLGSLVVEISANVAKFTSDMESVRKVAETNAQRMSEAFTGVGETLKTIGEVLAVAEGFELLKEKVEGAIQAAAGLEILSQRTGATVEGLANLSATARLSNTDNDALAHGLQKLSKSMIDAASGGAKTTAAFAAIGISTRDLVNLKPDEAFRLVAQRLNEYQDGAEKVAAAQLLMGKLGANMLPLLHDLAEGGEIQSRVTAEQAKQAEEFDKNIARLKVTFEENSNAIVQRFLPALSQLSENMLAAQKSGAGLLQTLISIPAQNLWAAITGTTVQERIDSTRDTIKQLQEALAHPYPGQTAEGLAMLANQAKAARAQLEGLLAQQRAAALQGAGDTSGLSDQVTRHLNAQKPVIQIQLSTQADQKAIRDAAIKDLDRAIATENATLTQREQFLQRYYSQDQISLQDYYTRRANVISENLRNVQADYAKEIAAAQAYANTLTGQDEKTKAARTAANEKIVELQDKSAKAASAASLALIQNGLDEQQAALQQREAIEQLNISLLRLQGRLEEAAEAQATLSTEQIPKRHLGAEGDAAARADIEATRISNLIAAKQKEISEVEQRESIAEQRLALEQQTGAIGTIEALQRLGGQRQAEIAQLEVLVERYDELAAKAGTPEAILAAQQLHLKLDQLKADADPLAAKFESMFETAFTDNFAKVIDGTESVRKAFSNMVNSIESELTKLAAQDIAKQIFGSGGGGPGSGFGGFLSSLFGQTSGGLAPGQAGPPAPNTGFFAQLLALLPAFAEGGDTSPGGAYLVGERGPEIFTPGQSGRVSPISAGHTININIGQGASVTRDSANMLGATVARHLAAVNARNN